VNCAEPILLVLDDEESIRLSLAAFFEDHGWRVLSSSSGEEALELLHAHAVDAAIVDIRMQGMTGDVFIRQAMQQHPGLVFLIFTGSLDYGIPQDLLQAPSVNTKVFYKPLLKLDEMGTALTLLLAKNKTS